MHNSQIKKLQKNDRIQKTGWFDLFGSSYKKRYASPVKYENNVTNLKFIKIIPNNSENFNCLIVLVLIKSVLL
jgi:hypothetical protein